MLKTPSTNNGFTIYRSSAGSGKTYRLAIEYISLCLDDTDLYSKVLAVTFTNKATKEMKERILGFLEALSTGSDNGLMQEIMKVTGLSEVVVKERATKVLDKILHNYSQLSIFTIDTFFQKIVKAFAKELGLLGNYSLELDLERVKEDIVDLLIDDVGKDEELTDWLVKFSEDIVESGGGWDIRLKVKEFAGEIFKEAFHYADEDVIPGKTIPVKDFLIELNDIIQSFERELITKAKEAQSLIDRCGLSVDDFSNKQSGPAGYFLKIVNKGDYKPGDRFRAAVTDESKWYTKTSDKKEAIQNALRNGLFSLANALHSNYEAGYRRYYSALEVKKKFYLYGILAKFTAKLNDYRHDNDLMLISDVPVFLQRIIAGNDAPFIYEKTGSRYRHYLIDEFQDTSRFQWGNFKPLIENGLAQGNMSLLVGDGKQSIYRWRGGDWNLILHTVDDDMSQYGVKNEPLNVNWRSEKNIVEFNNELYRLAPQFIASHLKSSIELADETLKAGIHAKVDDVIKLYSESRQDVAAKNAAEAKGRICVKVFGEDADADWTDRVLEQLPSDIEHLQDIGYSPGEIAILVRRAEEGRKVMECLIKHKNSMDAVPGYSYDSVSGESLFLGKSPAIRLLINSLRYCTDQKDAINLADIIINYHMISHEDEKSVDIDTVLNAAALPAGFKDCCAGLMSLPVYEMVEKFIQLFDLTRASFRGYIQSFQDLVLKYFSEHNKNLNDFLLWWQEDGRFKSVSASDTGNAIQVMTIHKSKGLEFGAVIIPFCNWNLAPETMHNINLWCKTAVEPFASMGRLPVKYGKSLEDTYFVKEYFEEMIKGHIDSLNLLYVASTRAESYLQINCPPLAEKLTKSGDVIAHAVKQMAVRQDLSFTVQATEDDPGNAVYEIGSAAYKTSVVNTKTEESGSAGYASTDWRRKVTIRKNKLVSDDSSAADWEVRVNYGLLVHEIMASINGEKEALEKLTSYIESGKIKPEEYEKASGQIRILFVNDQVKDWFSDRWKVKKEAIIISGKNRMDRPDRVLIDGARAIVIDFKTGSPRDKDERQVLSYVGLLKEMGYTVVEGHLIYVESGNILKVI